MRIYTRGGDKGKTGIHGGERVDKDDIRIEANGTLDELNAEIGIVRTLLPPDHEWQVLLGRIQREMMTVMSHVATPSAIRDKNPNPLPDDLAAFCESHIDDLSAQMEDNGYFILPGGTPVSAHLQLARTITRRAERRLWTLNRKPILLKIEDLVLLSVHIDLVHMPDDIDASGLYHFHRGIEETLDKQPDISFKMTLHGVGVFPE